MGGTWKWWIADLIKILYFRTLYSSLGLRLYIVPGIEKNQSPSCECEFWVVLTTVITSSQWNICNNNPPGHEFKCLFCANNYDPILKPIVESNRTSVQFIMQGERNVKGKLSLSLFNQCNTFELPFYTIRWLINRISANSLLVRRHILSSELVQTKVITVLTFPFQNVFILFSKVS